MLRHWLLVGVGLFGLVACIDHLDPRADRQRFEHERKVANTPKLLLEEGGKLPDLSVAGQPVAAVVMDPNVLYAQFCSSCHGNTGAADNATAAALNPRPRNLRDTAWQASVTDEHIYKVIEQGGQAVGLSSMMPPWGSQLQAEQVQALVGAVRAFGR
jgi:mono/diheme cytochrome c family protein